VADAHAYSPIDAGPQSQRSVWRFIAPLGIVILVSLAFIPALDAGFVDWDDDDLLRESTRHQAMTADNLRWMFTTSYAGHFQPLTWLSFALDYRLWRGDPFGYHLTSVVLHALTAVAFYFVAQRLLTLAVRRCDIVGTIPFVASASFASAVFACHPLRAESVAWIAERRDVLSGFFYMLSVGCYLRYATASDGRSPCPLPHGRGSEKQSPGAGLGPSMHYLWFYVGGVLCCVLSLLAKASAMTLPLVLLILDVYPLRRLGGPAGWWRGRAKLVWLEMVPWGMLGLPAAVRAVIAQQEGGALTELARHDVISRIAQACYGLMFYLQKTVWPTNLRPLYELPPREILLGPRFALAAAGVVVLSAVAIGLRRRCPGIAAALAVYAIVLAPVLGFLQSGPQLVADRYSYLSCLGPAVLAGGLMLRAWKLEVDLPIRQRRALVALGAVVVVALLVRATCRQADVWLSPLTLWSQGVRVSPASAIAHVNYGDALAKTQALEEAAGQYRTALELNPNDAIAWHHLADLHVVLGKPAPAIGYYRQALRLDPGRRRAYESLANILIDAGKGREAADVLREGARRHPNDSGIVDVLAQLLSTHPDPVVRHGQETVDWARRLVAIRGKSDPAAVMTFATALAEAGRFEEAVAAARQALAIAERGADHDLIQELRRRLTLFQQGKPYHFGE